MTEESLLEWKPLAKNQVKLKINTFKAKHVKNNNNMLPSDSIENSPK